MKARLKLILSTVFALVIASMVLLVICYQTPVGLTAFPAHERVEEARGGAVSQMSDASQNRVTMLRGFAYVLGRRCRVWRKAVRRPIANIE